MLIQREMDRLGGGRGGRRVVSEPDPRIIGKEERASFSIFRGSGSETRRREGEGSGDDPTTLAYQGQASVFFVCQIFCSEVQKRKRSG